MCTHALVGIPIYGALACARVRLPPDGYSLTDPQAARPACRPRGPRGSSPDPRVWERAATGAAPPSCPRRDALSCAPAGRNKVSQSTSWGRAGPDAAAGAPWPSSRQLARRGVYRSSAFPSAPAAAASRGRRLNARLHSAAGADKSEDYPSGWRDARAGSPAPRIAWPRNDAGVLLGGRPAVGSVRPSAAQL